MDPTLCVVLHDVAPATWPACRRVIDAVGEVAPVPLTLLAVPRYHGAPRSVAFDSLLTERHECGDELSLHGYTHRDDSTVHGPIDFLRRRFYTAGEGEFADLSREAALQRLVAGMRWFQANGWPLHGFVAPAWLLGRGAWQALEMVPLQYTSTLRRIHALPQRQSLVAPSIVYSTRSAWRRLASWGWNRLHDRHLQRRTLVRFELHPHDADHAWLRRSWQAMLAQHLEYRRAATVTEFVRQWQESLSAPTQPMAYHHPRGDAAAAVLQNSASTPTAMSPPIAAPATTSLG
jgi:predicted deacetylase